MRAVIADDEFLAREELKYFIQNYSSLEIVGEFEDGLAVLKFLQESETDVIFLDINMPSLDGVMLAKSVSRFAQKPKIVFVTAYREHAVEAFELEAFDYILKPYSEERIISVLQKLERSGRQGEREQEKQEPEKQVFASPMEGRLTLHGEDSILVVNQEDIYYCEARERSTLVHTKDQTCPVNQSISDFYEKLPHDRFFRCHRSYIVNIRKIREIIPWFNNTYNIRLADMEAQIPVSRGNVREFRQLMEL